MWEITLSKTALSDLSNLEEKDAERIVSKLEDASRDPQKVFKRLKGHDDYKLRVGDYRIIALLLHESKTIFIERIRHRKNIYKK